LVFSNCVFVANGGYGISATGGVNADGGLVSGFNVQSCWFEAHTFHIKFQNPGGVPPIPFALQGVQVSDSVFRDSLSQALWIEAGQPGAAGVPCQIKRCVFWENGRPQFAPPFYSSLPNFIEQLILFKGNDKSIYLDWEISGCFFLATPYFEQGNQRVVQIGLPPTGAIVDSATAGSISFHDNLIANLSVSQADYFVEWGVTFDQVLNNQVVLLDVGELAYPPHIFLPGAQQDPRGLGVAEAFLIANGWLVTVEYGGSQRPPAALAGRVALENPRTP
jgi:hypothetical protein